MEDLNILYSNKNWIAVAKPHGVSVHNVEDKVNLIELVQRKLNLQKLYPIHRLDKETSGVQVFGLNEEFARKGAEAFQNREVQKEYVAILRGQIKATQGIWTQSLSDKSEGRKNPQGLSKDRKLCETRFELIESNQYFSYVRFELITGRQHQIRKHCVVNKHHIVGDDRYGEPKYNKNIANMYQLQRMFLHCHKLIFGGVNLESEVPIDFQILFKK